MSDEEEDEERRRRVIIIRAASESASISQNQQTWLNIAANRIEAGERLAEPEMVYARFLVGFAL